ncbi:MAG: DNA alkylation repair protein [Acetobacteraceae bacterium]
MSMNIPPAHLAALQEGSAETRHLADMLAIDMSRLLRRLHLPPADIAALDLQNQGFVERMRRAGALLGSRYSEGEICALQSHASDTIRGFAAYATIEALNGEARQNASELCRAIRPFAADRHFGVREWAWMAVRPAFAARLAEAIDTLTPGVHDPDPNIRRFAIEVLRPRGVWTRHILALRRDPSPILPLLNPLRTETHKYVQDSVANWLNDAGKDNPAFVIELCQSWRTAQPDHPGTLRICRRAQRRLKSPA